MIINSNNADHSSVEEQLAVVRLVAGSNPAGRMESRWRNGSAIGS